MLIAARTTRRVACAASVAALLALATGCGSDDESRSANDATAASDAAATKPDGTPIKLAALIDDSGPNNGRQGDSIPVLEAWVKDANANGGVAGHPVSVQIVDTQGNPSKAASAVQKAIADRSVAGVISVDASTESGSVKTLSKAGLPVIGGVAYAPTGWGATKGNRYLNAPALPGVYAINTVYPANVTAYISAAKQYDVKKMVSVNFSQVPASKLATNLANAMAKGAGIEASSITVDASAPNFTAECVKIMQQKADYVIFTLPPDLAGRIVGDCNTQGYTGAYGSVGGGVTDDVYKKVGNNKLIGALWAFPWYTDSAAAKRFSKVMTANDVPAAKWQGAPGPVVWTTMELFRHTLEANRAKLGKTVTRRDVLAAYGTVRNETLDGMMPGPVTYTKGNVSPPKCYWLFSYENGKFSGSAEPTCPDKSFGAG